MTTPEISLYTNPDCPWAQRVHIVLKELNLPYKQVLIDVDKPREEWHLAINPIRRPLFLLSASSTFTNAHPPLQRDGPHQSGIIAQFLADAHLARETGSETRPTRGLLTPSNAHQGAIQRARVALLVDAWVPKVYAVSVDVILTGEDYATRTKSLVGVVEREIEPLLVSASASASPSAFARGVDRDGDENGRGSSFFGNSETLALAEVLVGPFLLWMFTLVKSEYGILSGDLISVLQERAPRFARWSAMVVEYESVRCVFDEEWVGDSLKGRSGEKMKE
ncbi:glutathione S-transferase N-terminal domain-containing protein [Aspergillus undulatus]|uniref:glutathione S-transferase N-terminal domain-containing protein n=1 Tax=Aspergillus undulatus TaxID=1810928 RepID=UPI003CCCB7C3